MPKSEKYKLKPQSTWLLGALCALIIASVLASRSNIFLTERTIFLSIYNLPAILAPFSYLLTFLGSIWLFTALVMVTYMTKYKELSRSLFINGSIAYVIALILKELIARPRPQFLYDGVIVRYNSPQGLGFPSAHAALSTALALTLLTYVSPKYHFLLALWVVGVGFSRIYLGVHMPLDVVGGLLVGVVVVLSVQIMTAKLKQARNPANNKT